MATNRRKYLEMRDGNYIELQFPVCNVQQQKKKFLFSLRDSKMVTKKLRSFDGIRIAIILHC